MKTAFFLIVLVHGLIHLLGFVKGFEWREVKELTLPVSRPMGLAWLTATGLMVAYGVLFLLNSRYAWIAGLIALVTSQLLILLFWKDAKWGTIPNIAILAVSMTAMGHYRFQKLIDEETSQLLERTTLMPKTTVQESDFTHLPEPVKKWLRNSGLWNQPFIYNGKVTQHVDMQMKPGQDGWLAATAVQYTVIDDPSFIWTVDVKMNRFLSFQGRDKYQDGKGEMLIKLNSLYNIVNERGDKLNESTLQRYLGEMVWFPSLALSPTVTWQPIDEHTAKATMTYKGVSGSGTFHFTPAGDVAKFAALRYKGNDAAARRYEWEVEALDYRTFEGIRVPARITSTWKLEDHTWTWLKMEVTDIRYNRRAADKGSSQP